MARLWEWWKKPCWKRGAHATRREEVERFRADFQFSEAIDSLKPCKRLKIKDSVNRGMGGSLPKSRGPDATDSESFAESQKHRDALITQQPSRQCGNHTVSYANHGVTSTRHGQRKESKDVLAQIKQAIKIILDNSRLLKEESNFKATIDLRILRTQLLRRCKQQEAKTEIFNERKGYLLLRNTYDCRIVSIPHNRIDENITQLRSGRDENSGTASS